MKAIIYARVSTVGQAEEGISIDSQLEQCRRKAEQLGAEVLREFRDEGKSGRKSDRPAFQAAIEYCTAVDVDYFIVWNTARFARNKVDAGMYKQLLRRDGTRVVYVANDIDSDTDEGWMMEGLFEMMDEHYSRTVSKDTKRSMVKNARDGYFNGGYVPFGYRSVADGKRRKLEVDPAEAELVRKIYREFLEGAGVTSITLALNGAGLQRRGKPWSKNNVIYLLQNAVCAGYIRFNRQNHTTGGLRERDEWILTRAHEAIVSEEEFQAVQAIFAKHEPRPRSAVSTKSQFRFSGMLRCADCNLAMQLEWATGKKGKTYCYYNCGSARRGVGCRHRRLPAELLDQWLLASVLDRIMTRKNMEAILQEINQVNGRWVQDRKVKRAALVADMRSKESRRRRLLEVLELHGKDAPNLGDIGPRLSELNHGIREIERQLTELEAVAAPALQVSDQDLDELSKHMREIVQDCQDARKVREFLATIIDQVVLHDGEAEIRYRAERLVGDGGGFSFSAPGTPISWKTEHQRPHLALRQVVIPLPDRFRRAA